MSSPYIKIVSPVIGTTIRRLRKENPKMTPQEAMKKAHKQPEVLAAKEKAAKMQEAKSGVKKPAAKKPAAKKPAAKKPAAKKPAKKSK